MRDSWGWGGFFVSDCSAIGGIFEDHNYTDSWNATIRAALHDGGVDQACDDAYPEHMMDAYASGAVALADMQAAATNFLRQVSDCALGGVRG